MEMKKITGNDIPAVLRMIKEEFPYVSIDRLQLEEKMANPTFYLFKYVEKEKIIGFTEIEVIDEAIARINALIIIPSARGKNYGKEFLEKVIKFLQSEGIHRILLLVREDNKQAKKMYSSLGFKFVNLYQQWDTGITIEELELDLEKETPNYVT